MSIKGDRWISNQDAKRRMIEPLSEINAFAERSIVFVKANSAIVPPNSFALARLIEYYSYPQGCTDNLRM
jgi:hypothetical protein